MHTKYISKRATGYLVRVRRAGRLASRYVPYATHKAWASTLAARVALLAKAGPRICSKAHSNTGIVGISESVHWRHNHSMACFAVTTRRNKRNVVKRVYFGGRIDRKEALRRACVIRLNGVKAHAETASRRVQRPVVPTRRRGEGKKSAKEGSNHAL